MTAIMKACPFCGTRRLVIERARRGWDMEKYWVSCTVCASRGPARYTMEAAIEAFDSREDCKSEAVSSDADAPF